MQAGFFKPLLRSEFISENYQNLAHLQIVDQAPPAAGCESWLAGQYADARRRPSCGGTHDDGWSRIRLDLRPCIDVLFHSGNARGTCVLCVLCVPSSGMWRAACLSEQTGKTTTSSAGVLSCGILSVTRRYLCSIPQMMNSVWLSGDAIASAVTTGLLYNQSHVSGAPANGVCADADTGRGVRHVHRRRV